MSVGYCQPNYLTWVISQKSADNLNIKYFAIYYVGAKLSLFWSDITKRFYADRNQPIGAVTEFNY